MPTQVSTHRRGLTRQTGAGCRRAPAVYKNPGRQAAIRLREGQPQSVFVSSVGNAHIVPKPGKRNRRRDVGIAPYGGCTHHSGPVGNAVRSVPQIVVAGDGRPIASPTVFPWLPLEGKLSAKLTDEVLPCQREALSTSSVTASREIGHATFPSRGRLFAAAVPLFLHQILDFSGAAQYHRQV